MECAAERQKSMAMQRNAVRMRRIRFIRRALLALAAREGKAETLSFRFLCKASVSNSAEIAAERRQVGGSRVWRQQDAFNFS
jgi:hypothetical protein